VTLLIDLLRREHESIAALLDTLEAQVAVLAEAGEPDYDVLQALAEYFTDYPALVHHPKEDLIWQALKARDAAAAAAVGDLPAEHARLAKLVHGFGAIVHDDEVPRDAATHVIRRFIEAERQHIAMEEESFLPAAARALRPEDWTALTAETDWRPDPLAEAADRRFAALRRVIAESARPTTR
jgi:hemerythrin-like domain-containing protein